MIISSFSLTKSSITNFFIATKTDNQKEINDIGTHDIKKRYNITERGDTTITNWSTSLPTEKQKNTIVFLSQL